MKETRVYKLASKNKVAKKMWLMVSVNEGILN
jgi:hypothetical protein